MFEAAATSAPPVSFVLVEEEFVSKELVVFEGCVESPGEAAVATVSVDEAGGVVATTVAAAGVVLDISLELLTLELVSVVLLPLVVEAVEFSLEPPDSTGLAGSAVVLESEVMEPAFELVELESELLLFEELEVLEEVAAPLSVPSV